MKISVVVPIFNEEASIRELCERTVKVCESIRMEFEIILVENGSTDSSLEILKELRGRDKRIKYISLSRNFGHQGGIWAGMTFAKGEAVITMDGDLQHPPEMIKEFVGYWEKGFEVVNTVKNCDKEERRWKVIFSKGFYRLIGKVSDIELKYGQSDFRLLDRKVIDALLKMPERDKFLRGLVDWVGFRQVHLAYSPDERKSGKSKFRFSHYFNFALNGIFSFSILPLRAMLILGVVLSASSFLYAIFVFAMVILAEMRYGEVNLPPGWATIAVGITFFGGIQMLGLGILGEYLARVASNVRGRPDFIIKSEALD